jgi:hypothetical protein
MRVATLIGRDAWLRESAYGIRAVSRLHDHIPYSVVIMSTAASPRSLVRTAGHGHGQGQSQAHGHAHVDPDGLILRIKSEYREMPGLSLTHTQAQRLWHLDEGTCRTILARLVSSGFLRLTPKGHYTRT